MDRPARVQSMRREAIAAYKTILKLVLDQRPSGMRNRLAVALGKNRSFVSQITNPAYETPIPSGHLAALFEICHFSAEEKRSFLEAYEAAHPDSRKAEARVPRTRTVSLRVPDFGDVALNAKVERLLQTLAAELGRTFARDGRRD